MALWGSKSDLSEQEEGVLPVHGLTLNAVTETGRFRELSRMESYYRCTQYDHMRYDWDGNFQGYGGEADIKPGWYVPLKRRKPSARWDLARTTVSRFTALLFGTDRWPEMTIDGDEDAESFLKFLVRESKLQSKMIEARTYGGSEGTGCLSFAFVKGKPRVQVHDPKNVTVLQWDDPEQFRPSAVLEAYSYKRRELQDGKIKDVDYYYARYWDAMQEVVWAPIPMAKGNQGNWAAAVPHKRTVHGYGFCPFYWIQNLPNSSNVDGESDYQGLTDLIDEINRLLSATSKGTVANVDPTLIIKSDPSRNDGSVKKGSGRAIYSPGGAEYLEIKGDAVRASLELLKELRGSYLETAQVVLADPDKMAAKGLSGEALRLLYAPMLAKCDLMRDQYGSAATEICADMLRAAKIVLSRVPDQKVLEDGEVLQEVPSLKVPSKIETIKEIDEQTGNIVSRTVFVERSPGNSEDITLNWGPYFASTWRDIQAGTAAAKDGTAGKAVMSHKTAVKLISSMTGVKDIEEELRAIDEDSELIAERDSRLFGAAPPIVEMKTEEKILDEPLE